MIQEGSLLVALVRLVDRIPEAPRPEPRRGRPVTYSDRVFLKALVIMIVRDLPTVHLLLSVLEQPTPEMQRLRALLTENGRFPSRRTWEWERRLGALPARLPARIGCLGRFLVGLLQPWQDCGRAAAIDSTVLRARGGVWAVSGTRRIGKPGSSRTARLTPKRTGPSRAGTAGSTGGSSIWSRLWPPSGSRWRPS